MLKLTSEQQRVYDFMVSFRDKNGFPPTVREVAAGLGYKSPNNARQHMQLIEQKGYIRTVPSIARGIEFLNEATAVEKHENIVKEEVEEYGVPLIGSVAAGLPITAIENVDGYITLDRSIFKGNDLFALRVKGNSMTGMGILNGDIVVVRKKSNAENGEVVVVIIDGDATLKRFIRDRDTVLLRAENPDYADIVLSSVNSIQIAGKLVGVIRKY
ncbi:MAG TPA: transcriptional repressor LexA [Chitinispirillaceae bacterium]|nr:transcriptional repressor LexA [Chitinispirillaceae bacterium]